MVLRGVGDDMDGSIILLFILMLLGVIGLLSPVLSLLFLAFSFVARIVSLIIGGLVSLALGSAHR